MTRFLLVLSSFLTFVFAWMYDMFMTAAGLAASVVREGGNTVIAVVDFDYNKLFGTAGHALKAALYRAKLFIKDYIDLTAITGGNGNLAGNGNFMSMRGGGEFLAGTRAVIRICKIITDRIDFKAAVTFGANGHDHPVLAINSVKKHGWCVRTGPDRRRRRAAQHRGYPAQAIAAIG